MTNGHWPGARAHVRSAAWRRAPASPCAPWPCVVGLCVAGDDARV